VKIHSCISSWIKGEGGTYAYVAFYHILDQMSYK
jgi:hypothetical protein